MTVFRAAQARQASSEAQLPLRMAQRAFAALIESGDRGEFVLAQLRSAARRTLSALSADEQLDLSHWLGLQLATTAARDSARADHALARVDAMLAAGVVAILPRLREALQGAARRDAAVA